MGFSLFHAIAFFLSLFTLPFVSFSDTGAGAGFQYLKLPLLRKNPFPPNPAKTLSADSSRLSALFTSVPGRRAKLPVTSGANFGTGQYFVQLRVGTPAQELFLVADTGSDLVWVTCSACRECLSRGNGTAFFTRRSSTFRPLHCFDSKCKLVPPPANASCRRTRRGSACRYEYSYADGSLTSGIFARETTTFNVNSGRAVTFKNVELGCSLEASGPSVTGPSFNGAQGVLGLGRGPISLATQLGRRFGNKFSYCLKDYTLAPTPTSYLLIGGSKAEAGAGAVNDSKMNFTPILNNPLSPTFYYIGIENIFIDNVKLPISPAVWATDEMGNGGTILDSGTTLTFLVEPAYTRIVTEFKRRVKLPKPAAFTSTFDLCVNVSGVPNPSLPQLSIQLAGGSVFSPPTGNYFLDTAPDIKCLSLQPVTSSSGSSVIGNLMQQGFVFEFDNDHSRLGFSRHGCSLS
nr:aspartyl protease family protein 2 [Ipomoea batatas]GME15975.1 aspartyl protease family protein 2 [Ipomoea batatas]GME17648.1 aspartyl protease family protein 2 [Ipomoea batatas]GME21152.1 aspartyl protease family protein 2 [Ipomoea batatas]